MFFDDLISKNFNEAHLKILEYIDMLVKMISPKNLLMITADGVAPYAKILT